MWGHRHMNNALAYDYGAQLTLYIIDACKVE